MVRQDDRFDHISGKIFKGLQSAFEQVPCCCCCCRLHCFYWCSPLNAIPTVSTDESEMLSGGGGGADR